MKRSHLKEMPMEKIFDKPQLIITMNPGQWDKLLEDAYQRGHTLLELDDNEIPIRAYRKDPEIFES